MDQSQDGNKMAFGGKIDAGLRQNVAVDTCNIKPFAEIGFSAGLKLSPFCFRFVQRFIPRKFEIRVLRISQNTRKCCI